MIGKVRCLRRVSGLLLAAMLGASACTVAVEGAPSAITPERRGPAGTVPTGLERYYGQALYWGDCRPFATMSHQRGLYRSKDLECTQVEVPLDYADPDGRTISLAVLRRPAGDPERRIGVLLINPGGPGASGMEAAAALSAEIEKTSIGERFDFVGFDPRG